MVKGIYVHIPFCSLKCPYCDFLSFVSFDQELHSRYIQAVIREAELYIDNNFMVETIYFGGGTPSLLKPSYIEKVINHILKVCRVSERLEITMEVNPNTYSLDDFKEVKTIGVNRLSFGAQSFLEKNLRKLGRDHTPQHTLKSVENAFKSGIENINLDLIYGVEGQTLDELNIDLGIYLSLPIKHISAYMLTAYEDTPLGVMVKSGQVTLPDDDVTASMFELIDERLHAAGLARYELSNWAVDGYRCIHNILYWTHQEFLGFGVSAWSFVGNRRFGNTRNIWQYISMVEEGKKPVMFEEELDQEKIREEKIFLGLRLSEGIEIELVKDKDLLHQLVEEGYGEITGDRFRLLPKGIMVLNYIASMLI